MTLILALAFACQQAPAPTPSREDLELVFAVEDFVRATPPEPYRSMIRDLGQAKWKDREAASKTLESAVRSDPGSLLWLFVGRRDADPEIRLRSNAILRRLYPCRECKDRNPEMRQWWTCDECLNTASAWPRGFCD